MAQTENNRARLANDNVPESIIAVMKAHNTSDVFAVQACRALIACISKEDDDLIPRIANAGVTTLMIRALRKHNDNEELSKCVFNLIYYIACDPQLISRLISNDILECLSTNFESHAGFEEMAEWGCRTLHKLLQLEGVTAKMRTAGLCEMIVSTVQRQAISQVVSAHGCLAVGGLAADMGNQARLSAAGACEAVVGALKRHDDYPDVVVQSCFAIHFLCFTQNNVSWMGAIGGCEAVTQALNKHIDDDISVTQSAARAVGSLAFKDEGNQLRLKNAGACSAVVIALRSHGNDLKVAEFTCRAVYNMCSEPTNVSEYGAKGVCGLIVATLSTHMDEENVLTQACLAISSLAVKRTNDKVHNGNTRKLVSKGALECVVEVMQKYPMEISIQRAGAMAISSLGRLDLNKTRLGTAGACELILKGFSNHPTIAPVLSKLCTAIDTLSMDNEVNKGAFAVGGGVEFVLSALHKHEKSDQVVGESLRALITLSTYEGGSYRNTICSQKSIQLYMKTLKHHDKVESVAHWGCAMIYNLATTDALRERLGGSKACEIVTNILHKHSSTSALVSSWALKAIVALSLLENNRIRFQNTETCHGVTAALSAFGDNEVVAEMSCAAIVSMSVYESSRIKFGTGGVCTAIVHALKAQNNHEKVLKLGCQAISELCLEAANRRLLGAAGGGECLLKILKSHTLNLSLSHQCCRAMTGFLKNDIENAAIMGALGVSEVLSTVLKQHAFSVVVVEWCCSAMALLAESADNQLLLGNSSAVILTAPPTVENEENAHDKHGGETHGSFKLNDTVVDKYGSDTSLCYLLAASLNIHKNAATVVIQITRAIRSLANNQPENKQKLANVDILNIVLKILKIHRGSEKICENIGWILANIDPTPVSMSSTNIRTDNLLDLNDGNFSEISLENKNGVKIIKVEDNDEVYKMASNWDLLLGCLETHVMKEQTTKWLCAGLGVFADRGR
jgi:hypothetical protein